MTESNQRILPVPTAINPGDELSCEIFLRLRRGPSVSDEQFARTVLSASIFEQKSQLVANVLARRWRADRIDDALQDAAISVYSYLSTTRGVQFAGRTDDALGAWLYRLILRHAQWALAKISRSEQRRRAREAGASRQETHQVASSTAFEGMLDRVFDLLRTLPSPLCDVGLDMYHGVPVKDTASALGISETQAYKLRARVQSIIVASIDDLIA